MSLLEVALVPRRVIRYAKINGVHRTELPEYQVYTGMIARCKNPNVTGYSSYGGRGIRVCDRWVEDFKHFYDDMGPRPSAKHSIDRINPNGNYEPGNCRWATSIEQAATRRHPKEASRDNPFYWSPEEEAILRRLFSQFASYEEIGMVVGRTTATVRLRCFNLGLRRDGSITRLSNKYPELQPVLRARGVDAFLVALKQHVDAENQAKKDAEEAQKGAFDALVGEIMGRQVSRNEKMRALRLAGVNMAQIGGIFGITRERVRQLQLKDFADPLKSGRKVHRSKNKAKHAARLVRAWNTASQEARIAFLEIATDPSARLPVPVPAKAQGGHVKRSLPPKRPAPQNDEASAA